MKTTLLLIIPMALLSAATNSDRPIDATAAFEKLKILAGIPHVLFEAVMQDVGARNRWVVTRDGQKFLAVVPVNENPVDSFRVILNWPSLLRQKQCRADTPCKGGQF